MKIRVNWACKNCMYWDGGKISEGNCRVRPPRIRGEVASSDPRYPGYYSVLAVWPRTQADDWCGKFSVASYDVESDDGDA